MLRVLVDAGAGLQARDGIGRTALMRAAKWNSNPEVVLVLIDAGADGATGDWRGRTAFDHVSANEALHGTDVYWRLHAARFR